MQKNKTPFKLSITNFIKTFFVGIFSSLAALTIYYLLKDAQGILGKFCWWSASAGYILLILLFLFYNKFWLVIKSIRLDLYIIFAFGVYAFFNFSEKYTNFLLELFSGLNTVQKSILIYLPLIFIGSLVFYLLYLKIKIYFNNKNFGSIFINDDEINDPKEDRFGFKNKAKTFAKYIMNNQSPKSIVFGIDAPWGTGKSSFVNLCKYYLKEQESNIIIYNFNPTRYEDESRLLEKFIFGFINEIKSQIYVPEIDALLLQFSKLINSSNPSINIFGFNFDLPRINETFDNTYERLEHVLLSINKKVIIVIDDLDRLDFYSVKRILFSIKKVFSLPNISFILCYDTKNILSTEKPLISDGKISEYFEKYINIKYSLCINYDNMLQHFLNESLKTNILTDLAFLSKSISGLKDIYESDDFIYYRQFIGDARKLKRLINTIVLLQIDKTDFDNSDIDKTDLINLLIIYINYPRTFRDIIDTETKEKRGTFSLVTNTDDSFPKDKDENTFQNSTRYNEYKDGLDENHAKILDKIFARKAGKSALTITREEYSTYACFNGHVSLSSKGNLEKYIDLIVNAKHPIKEKEFKFYVNLKKKIFEENKPLPDVLINEIFNFSNSESYYKELWDMLANALRTIDYKTISKIRRILNYAICSITQFSFLSLNNVLLGFRYSLPLYIVQILDKLGWYKNEEILGSDNNEENTLKIAYWIFGEKNYIGNGIIQKLSNEDRGLLGFFDLMIFRLYCCADRGGDVFNLMRGLIAHGNPKDPQSNKQSNLLVDEMREMSQVIFKIFHDRYIKVEKNIFKEIDDITLEEFCSKYYHYVKAKNEAGKIIDLDKEFIRQKAKYKSFIIYQLGTTIIAHGIGCGYYDLEGNEDNHEINGLMNDYLFDICFNPDKDENNYMCFLDYLFHNYSQAYIRDTEFGYIPNINEFTKVLTEDRLKDYWERHRKKIVAKKFQDYDKTVITLNYEITYSKEIQNLYRELDKLLEQETTRDRVNK